MLTRGVACVIVATIQSFRVEDKDGRKVYEASGALMDHFSGLHPEQTGHLPKLDGGGPIPSLANLLRLHRPLVIVDEAHNARTALDAKNVAQQLAHRCINGVLSSPMQRAVATAKIVAERLSVPLVVVEDLAERRWGDFEGRPRSDRPPLVDPPSVETQRALQARVAVALRAMYGKGHFSEGTLILAHAGVFRAILIDLGQSGVVSIDHGGVVEISVDRLNPNRAGPG